MAEKWVEEPQRADPEVPGTIFEPERRLLDAIALLASRVFNRKAAKRPLQIIAARSELNSAANYAATCLREYGAWLVSEDGRTRLAVWDASQRAEDGQQTLPGLRQDSPG